MKRYRKSTWGLVVWTALIGLWLVSGMANVAQSHTCDSAAEFTQVCQAGTTVGAGIAIVFIGGLWFMGFLVGSVVWFASKSKGQ